MGGNAYEYGYSRGNRSHIGRESYLGVNEKNYRKGFTLVELIVVLVILAILAVIAVPVTLGFIDKAREKEFVANAETSLSATQTVLNDVYNDGLGCLPVTKRIEAYNAALAGKIENNGETTSFKIWTSKKLEHGKTHATKNEIGSYTIAKALFISDGKAAVYDGTEWKIYDKESDAIVACAGFQNDITIWPIENASSFKDDAYDPTLANSLVGIIAQRLVRKVCPDCGEWGVPTEEEIRIVGRPLAQVKHKVGCKKCNGTGYRGRISIHEILPIDKPVRKMISDNQTAEEIKEYARTQLGMLTLKESCMELIEQGMTTVEELVKVAYYD